MGRLRTTFLIGSLALWYVFTGPSDEQRNKQNKYSLPREICVTETSLPYKTRERVWKSVGVDGKEKTKIDLEYIVNTEEIDFSSSFSIKTERYKIVKEEECLPSKIISHICSIPSKIYFWDLNAGWGLDAKRTKAVLAMLENNNNISNLTVRINHNEVLYDCYRLFSDKSVSKRNNLFARLFWGCSVCLGAELLSGLSRGDYYNPATQTVVLFSNIESMSGHEIGHHQDYQRFESDWKYAIVDILPPLKLYKEWRASQNSKELLSKDDEWQFNRFLLPAFLTYLIASYAISKKYLQKKCLPQREMQDIHDIEEDKRSFVHPLQTLRHFATQNASFYAGIVAYSAVAPKSPGILSYLSFAGAMLGLEYIADKILKFVVPYNHE